MKLCFAFICLSIFSLSCHAQTLFDKYLDFNEAVVQHQTDKALTLGNEILNSSEKLPAKSQIKFYSFMAKLYEDGKQADNAIKYYELVLVDQPDYYVAHRALGYLYLAKANTIAEKSLKAIGDASPPEYIRLVKLALPHLEKDEACEPDKDELEQIKSLYDKTDDSASLATLNARLKQMSGKCVDLLTD